MVNAIFTSLRTLTPPFALISTVLIILLVHEVRVSLTDGP